MFKKHIYQKTVVFLLAIFLTATNASATKYICDGWEYTDGSKSNKAVKFEINGSSIKVAKHPYVIAGETRDKWDGIDEVFIVLDYVKMDGSRPLMNYNFILVPCLDHDGYSFREKRMFDSCKRHNLLRIQAPIDAYWKKGMSKTTCRPF